MCRRLPAGLTNPGRTRLLRPSPGVNFNGKLHRFAGGRKGGGGGCRCCRRVFFNTRTRGCGSRRLSRCSSPLPPLRRVYSHRYFQPPHFWYGGYFEKTLSEVKKNPLVIPRHENPSPKNPKPSPTACAQPEAFAIGEGSALSPQPHGTNPHVPAVHLPSGCTSLRAGEGNFVCYMQ